MPQRYTFIVQWLSATLILAAPAVIVLLLLVVLEHLSWQPAGFGTLAIVLVIGEIVRRHLRDLTAIRNFVEQLTETHTAATPHVMGMLPNSLISAVRHLNRSWHSRAEALRDSIAINQPLLDSLPDPIILLSAERQVLFSNAAARRQLGASGIGHDLAHLIRDPRVLESASAVLQGAGRREVSLEIVDPAARHFAVRIEPLREETASGGTCVIAMIDLTAMKRVEETRSDFIANASHELRTPLSSLIGFIETLRGPARDDAQAREQFLELMNQQAQRMARLVRDLLSLSTIEMSEHVAPSGAVALDRLLRGVADSLQIQARARNVTIDIQSDQDLPTILGDGDQLTQLFQNLIDNAIKYGAADSTVTVTAREDSWADGKEDEGVFSVICVAIKDQGDGIPKEHLPRLTERFYRVDAARSRAVGGTGLGLAIVKHIVSRHRGFMRIESELGQGTAVSVYLPISRESALSS